MLKLSRPVVYTALAAVGVAAWVMTSEEPPKASSKKRATASSKSSGNDKLGFTEEDYKATAASFIPAPSSRNAFQPVIARTRSAQEIAIAPDAVPAELAGGDPNWFFTGNAEVDGKPTALLDNRVTGESEFVSKGQRWKKASVVEIGAQSLVLAGPSGRKVKITLNNGDMTIYPGSPNYAGGYQPVSPALRGPIGGNGISVRPDRTGQRGTATEARDAN